YQGHVCAALIIGGVDLCGPSIYTIDPHGSSKNIYDTMDSGSLAAMSVLEMGWKPYLKWDEAKQHACDAIAAAILNDLGSGAM
ncbi:Proteasome subunit beta type-7, partial [Araneus ventricosus]